MTRYKQVYQFLKLKIQQGEYGVGSQIPSENELCRVFSITRTTARSALDELAKDGYIDRQRGRRSVVKERRHSLGLLNVKGFSEVAGSDVVTEMLVSPHPAPWPEFLPFPITREESDSPCVTFCRLRHINMIPVMYETNWYSSGELETNPGSDFIEGSFFKTLSQKYLIEITGSEQELHALLADKEISEVLKVKVGHPVLQIFIRFSTSIPGFNIYGMLYCNTDTFPIGNSYSP